MLVEKSSFIFFIIASFNLSYGQISNATCGVQKTCVTFPTGCSPTSPDCVFFAYDYKPGKDVWEMEMSGRSGNNEQYISIAFSSVNKMKNMDCYFCTGSQLLTGVVKDDDPIIDEKSVVSDIKASTIDGVAQCTFTRPNSIKRKISNDVVQDFNLQRSPFYIQYAGGKYENKPKYHHDDYGVSDSMQSFSFNALSSECGKNIGCFQVPENCSPGGDCMFFSWLYEPKSKTFKFTIAGRTGESDNYMAFGFAPTSKMKDVDVYYCTKYKMGVSSIAELGADPIDLQYEVASTQISQVLYSEIEGSVFCTFTRPAGGNRSISGGKNKDFDLTKEQFYILYSTAGVSSTGGMLKHKSRKDLGSSSTKIDFTKFKSGSPGSQSYDMYEKLVRAHAILMMLAWMVFSNIGVVVARHFKLLWPNNKILNKPVWFQVHTWSMYTTFGFTLLSFVLIFSAVKGFSGDEKAHAITGIFVTLLTVINPVMAFFRPDPKTEKRKFFNMAHFVVGLVCRILSVTTMFLGLKLDAIDIEQFNISLFIVFIINQILVEVVLEVLSIVYGHIQSFIQPKPQHIDKSYIPKYLILAYSILTNLIFMGAISHSICNS